MAEDLRVRYARAIANAECEQRPRCVLCMTAAVMAVRDEELERLRQERDQAIAHDRQPYPTQWAYDRACEALYSMRERAETAEAAVARIRELHHVHRCEVDGHVLARTPNPCVNDGVCHGCSSFSCKTLAALDASLPPEEETGA